MIQEQKTQSLTLENLITAFRDLGLAKGDTVLVQSSFKAFGGIQGGPKTVIQALLEVLSPEGTLAMPTFNWNDFGEKKLYSKLHTKPQTGILSEMLMNWEGAHRIYHPIHGFSLVGAKAKEFSQKVKNESSFEASSFFGELHRMNAKLMLLGVNYGKGLTFFHYVEEMVSVPYRKFIMLHGRLEELDGTIHDINIPYYGRASLGMHYNLDKIEPFLEGLRNSIVVVKRIGMSTVKLMNACDVYNRISETLKKHPALVLQNVNYSTPHYGEDNARANL